jgi:hypothetical protein
MEKKKKNYNTPDRKFKRALGVMPKTFEKMLGILEKEYEKLHKRGGRPPKLSVKDKLTIALKYLREYRTMENIAYDYGVAKSTVCESIQWVEDTLRRDDAFKLPSWETLTEAIEKYEYYVVDVTESPIERPTEGQKEYYSGKKTTYHENSGDYQRHNS